MTWLTIIRLLVVWYFTVQLIAVVTLPLTLYVLRGLPERGYSFAKISGVLLVGVIYWLGFSYGLIRNERGGAWLALIVVGACSWLVGWRAVKRWWSEVREGGRLRAVITAEVVFALAFVGWALVRAYDPNVDHTEQPMDLMFMNSIWASATYPPQDAWLAGYAISYYYLGYWLLSTVARIANTVPEIAYNIGQALWYGLLWSGCFGVVANLLAARAKESWNTEANAKREAVPMYAVFGGVFGAVTVALSGNLLVILEWLYAQGVNVERLARWIDVHNFPENATQTGQWYIDFGWWWWRSSRVIEDVDLLGQRIEVSPIDEFPMFSYLLGDNHPHVIAMPIVLFVIALAFNLMLLMRDTDGSEDGKVKDRMWLRWLPLTTVDILVYVIALGSLIFLNTWDFPPYWLLMVAVVMLGSRGSWRRAVGVGAVGFVATVALYFPYFLTAQSQAGGIVPNVFNPTRLAQFLVMFGGLLPAVAGMTILAWQHARPQRTIVAWTGALVLGGPIAWLGLSALVSSTARGQVFASRMVLPEGASSYTVAIIERWLSAPWTLLLVGMMLTAALAWIWSLLGKEVDGNPKGISPDMVFVMLLSVIGLALVYAPEFVYLRDNFGSRMNTVFKFYYQGWLLMGLVTAYLIALAFSELRQHLRVSHALAFVSFSLVVGGLLYPVAGVYAKTGGFARAVPTLDATAYVGQNVPDVMAAIEWVRANTTPDARVLEARGNSYAAHHNRVSTMTGRPTLLGWDGHESQWRGEAYGRMAQGRGQAIEAIYRTAPPAEVANLLHEWDIEYVFVGPTEIEMYGLTPARMDELSAELDTVFERGQVRIFRRRLN